MTQDVVRGRDEEEEIRQRELLQVVVALELAVVAAGGPRNHLALGAIELGGRQRLDEAQRRFDPALRRGKAGIVHRRRGGRRHAGQAAAGVHAEISRLTDLAGEAEHVGIQPILQQGRFLDLVGGTMRGRLVDDPRQGGKLLGAGRYSSVIERIRHLDLSLD